MSFKMQSKQSESFKILVATAAGIFFQQICTFKNQKLINKQV